MDWLFQPFLRFYVNVALYCIADDGLVVSTLLEILPLRRIMPETVMVETPVSTLLEILPTLSDRVGNLLSLGGFNPS